VRQINSANGNHTPRPVNVQQIESNGDVKLKRYQRVKVELPPFSHKFSRSPPKARHGNVTQINMTR